MKRPEVRRELRATRASVGAAPEPADRLARFWSKVDKSAGPDGCWVWTAHRAPKGYGRFWLNQTTCMLSHRYAHAIGGNPVAESVMVCHRCDNPPCVNPAHLFVGTNDDNMRDKVAKGRCSSVHQYGESHGGAKLSTEEVDEMRALYASGGFTHADLGARFGIHGVTAGKIIRGQSWAHTFPEPEIAPSQNPRKLTDADVAAIRSFSGTNAALAIRYGVNCATISRVRRGLSRKATA